MPGACVAACASRCARCMPRPAGRPMWPEASWPCWTAWPSSFWKTPREPRTGVERCLLCGSCAANCPSGVSALEIFLKARAILSGYKGLSPVKRAVFRGMLARPALFHRLTALAPKFQGIFGRPANDLLGTSCARLEWPLGKRHFPRLAGQPFHVESPALQRPENGSGITVAFFSGCIIDKLYPQVGRATAKALAHHRVGLQIPANQACCGIPALSAGDIHAFEKMAAPQPAIV